MNLSLSKPTKSILILCVLCLILIGIRIYFDTDLKWLFLVWNLFLAFTPLIFILLARKIYRSSYIFKFKKMAVLSLMMTWLLFFPNSPYIITDLIHLSHLPKNLIWFDATGIFVTALTALVMGFYSMSIFQQLAKSIFNTLISWVLIFSSLILSGFGIYLGRFLRLNSWDLFSNPVGLMDTILQIVGNKLAFQTTSVFSIVLIGLYLSYYNMLNLKNEAV
jgi:uncharacterized membrane protein